MALESPNGERSIKCTSTNIVAQVNGQNNGINRGAGFSKVPKLFGRNSGDMILFVSSKPRRLQPRNFAVILIFTPFTSYQKTSFTERAGRTFRNGFSGPKRFRDFRETGP